MKEGEGIYYGLLTSKSNSGLKKIKFSNLFDASLDSNFYLALPNKELKCSVHERP